MSIISRILTWYKFQYTFIFFDIAEFRHRWFAKRKMSSKEEESIAGQVVVITGASKGIGKASAMEFAKRKATIVMGCVDMKEGIKAMHEIRRGTGNTNLEVLYLDLSSMDAVQTFALEVASKYPKIKILFNNAGVGFSPEWVETKEGFNYSVAVNYLGHFLLTNLLADNLQLCGDARVIAMSSTVCLMALLDLDDFMMEKSGTGAFGSLPFVNMSLANALFMKELGKKLKGKGVTTYAVCPGAVRTDLWDTGRTTPFNTALVEFVLWAHAFTPEQTASEVIMHCALSKKLASQTGKFLRFKQNFTMGNRKLTPKLSRDLWKLSSQLVRLYERVPLFRLDINTVNNNSNNFITPL